MNNIPGKDSKTLDREFKEQSKRIKKQAKMLIETAPNYKKPRKKIKIIWRNSWKTILTLLFLPLLVFIGAFYVLINSYVNESIGNFFRAGKLFFWGIVMDTLHWTFPDINGGYYSFHHGKGSCGPAAFYWKRPKIKGYQCRDKEFYQDGCYPFWINNEKCKKVNKELELEQRKINKLNKENNKNK